ncbi:MAG: anaerobic ribonucleoside-triphosphate reductase activating protein [Butyrivibrio sp.]|nr:anaerobic ribonucleoside-triphosphate reductase activating protein [Butyrivibrio sp.]
MDIHGLQKMTILDYPEHVACTVFLYGCDFRCPYCHNFELVTGKADPVCSEEEFFEFLKKRQGILDGVVITGGEPCLRKELDTFIKKIKDLGFLIKLDTNGNHPDVLEKLLSENLLDYVAMDIKNSPDKYPITAGVESLDVSAVKRSVSILMSGKTDYEFRTTVVKELHSAEDFEEIGKWLQGARAYYLQQFVDRETVPDRALSSPSKADLTQYLEIVRQLIPNSNIRGI